MSPHFKAGQVVDIHAACMISFVQHTTTYALAIIHCMGDRDILWGHACLPLAPQLSDVLAP